MGGMLPCELVQASFSKKTQLKYDLEANASLELRHFKRSYGNDVFHLKTFQNNLYHSQGFS